MDAEPFFVRDAAPLQRYLAGFGAASPLDHIHRSARGSCRLSIDTHLSIRALFVSTRRRRPGGTTLSHAAEKSSLRANRPEVRNGLESWSLSRNSPVPCGRDPPPQAHILHRKASDRPRYRQLRLKSKDREAAPQIHRESLGVSASYLWSMSRPVRGGQDRHTDRGARVRFPLVLPPSKVPIEQECTDAGDSQ